jgi:large subunit ribosomal protein L23
MAKKASAEEKKDAVKAADSDKKVEEKKNESKETKKEQKSASTVKDSSSKSSSKKAVGFKKDPWNVIIYPHLAEKSMNMVEFENKLTFIVRRTATKKEIKEAVENLFDVKVIDVQTQTTTKGVKKAYTKLSEDTPASEIAARLGMV